VKLQFDFVAHPSHLISLDFNLCQLGCVPAMVTGNAATAAHNFIGAFCCSFCRYNSAAKGTAGWTFHEKMGKRWDGLENAVVHWAVNTTSGKLMRICI
jgi:hypothetical protein